MSDAANARYMRATCVADVVTSPEIATTDSKASQMETDEGSPLI